MTIASGGCGGHGIATAAAASIDGTRPAVSCRLFVSSCMACHEIPSFAACVAHGSAPTRRLARLRFTTHRRWCLGRASLGPFTTTCSAPCTAGCASSIRAGSTTRVRFDASPRGDYRRLGVRVWWWRHCRRRCHGRQLRYGPRRCPFVNTLPCCRLEACEACRSRCRVRARRQPQPFAKGWCDSTHGSCPHWISARKLQIT